MDKAGTGTIKVETTSLVPWETTNAAEPVGSLMLWFEECFHLPTFRSIQDRLIVCIPRANPKGYPGREIAIFTVFIDECYKGLFDVLNISAFSKVI